MGCTNKQSYSDWNKPRLKTEKTREAANANENQTYLDLVNTERRIPDQIFGLFYTYSPWHLSSFPQFLRLESTSDQTAASSLSDSSCIQTAGFVSISNVKIFSVRSMVEAVGGASVSAVLCERWLHQLFKFFLRFKLQSSEG